MSVFETNIRVLGSLLSNHMLASDPELDLMPGYQVASANAHPETPESAPCMSACHALQEGQAEDGARAHS